MFVGFISSASLGKPTEIDFPENTCGYKNIQYDNSWNNISENDTVEFYKIDENSNCGPPKGNDGCVYNMYMTNEKYSKLGYVPYTTWYTFENFKGNIQVTLRFNYNSGATYVIGTIPCKSKSKTYEFEVDKCMFNEELYSHMFYKHYKFSYFMFCEYDGSEVNFKLDQKAETFYTKYLRNVNWFNMVYFTNWNPQ